MQDPSSVEQGLPAKPITDTLKRSSRENIKHSGVRRTIHGLIQPLQRLRGENAGEDLQTIANTTYAIDNEISETSPEGLGSSIKEQSSGQNTLGRGAEIDWETYWSIGQAAKILRYPWLYNKSAEEAEKNFQVAWRNIDFLKNIAASSDYIDSGIGTVLQNLIGQKRSFPLRMEAVDILESIVPKIVEAIDNPEAATDPRINSDPSYNLAVIADLYRFGNKRKSTAKTILEHHIPMIAQGVKQDSRYIPLLDVLIQISPKQAIEIIKETLSDPDKYLHQKSRLISLLLHNDDTEIKREGKALLKKTIESFQHTSLTPEYINRLVKAWDASTIRKDQDGQAITDPSVLFENFTIKFNENLLKIKLLEEKQPGIVKELEENFGIRDFSRYSDELLLKQYRERDNKNIPYVLVITARYDHNGALAKDVTGSGFVLDHLLQSLKGRYALRLVEAESKEELTIQMMALDQHYGETQKIGGLVIRAHGEKDAMDVGMYADALKTTDVQRYGHIFKEFVVPGAPAVWISCDTGQAGGIAEQASDILEINSHAPDSPTNVSAIIPTFQGDKLVDLRPEYLAKNTLRSYRGEKNDTAGTDVNTDIGEQEKHQ